MRLGGLLCCMALAFGSLLEPLRAADGMISYATTGTAGLSLHVVNPDGTRDRDLNVPLSTYEPRMSIDGKKIVFTVTGYGTDDGTYVIDSNGTSLERRFAIAQASTPSLAPDNIGIAYSVDTDIKYRRADGTTLSLTSSANNEFRPRFSPDGLSLVYEDGAEVYKRVLSSGSSINLTNNAANDTYPSFSPDGTKIVFNSTRSPAGIYIMNADGTNPTRIPNASSGGFDACFSPDGTRIVYKGTGGLRVIGIDGTNDTLIVPDTNASHPTWAPGEVPPLASVNDAVVTEGNSGTVNLVFTISLSRKADATQTVTYETSNVTAFAPSDYTARSGSVTFAAGQNTQTVTIPIVPDTFYETDETFKITLTEASVAILNDAEGVGTIVNDDSFGSKGGKIVFDSNRGSNRDIYVMNADGSGVQRLTTDAAGDYNPSFSPDGRRIAFYSFRDGNYEIYVMNADGTGQTRLTNNAAFDVSPQWTPDGAEIYFASNRDGNYEIYRMNADGSGLSRRSNRSSSETEPAISPNGRFMVFAHDGNGTNDIVRENTSQLFNAPNPFELADSAGQDTSPIYRLDGNKIAFATTRDGRSRIYIMDADGANETPVSVNTGNEYEPCYSPDGLKIAFAYDGTGNREIYSMNAIGTGVTNLTNNAASDESPHWGPGDVLPGFSIANAEITEGDSGTKTLTFTVMLSWASTQIVSVNYATGNGTATAGSDYTATNGGLTFLAGQTSKTFTVPILGDTTFESDETFNVTLSSPTNAEITTASATGKIINDDSRFSINDVAIAEGNSGTTNATFTVSLSPANTNTVSVQYATANGTTFPATAPGDYTSVALTTLTFTPGQTSKTFTVPIVGDALDEENETFFVNLSGAVGATIADAQGVGTITDDDAPSQLSIANSGASSINEGNTSGGSAAFVVTLAPASGRVVTLQYQTRDLGATAGSDYTAASGTLTFNPGETTKNVTVNFIGDTAPELDESFFLDLRTATNATISPTADDARATILNDDGPVVYILAQDPVIEGDTGTVAQSFTVMLSQVLANNVTVNWATANNTANANDYTAASGSLTFTPGQTSKVVTVQVKGDDYDEADESYFVNLSNASGASILPTIAEGIIEDDDAGGILGIEVSDVTSVNESGTLTFTITLSDAAAQAVTLNYATANGTASASDYTARSGALGFPIGHTSLTVAVPLLDDALSEGNETLFLNLTNPVNATIRDAQGLGTITDDEPPAIFASDITITEANSAAGTAIFTINLTAPSSQTVTVNAATLDNSAKAGSDYVALPSTLVTFAPGQTSRTVNVTVNGDLVDEADEIFKLRLTGPVNATVADNEAQCTILDNDATPQIRVTNASIVEGNSSSVALNIPVTLSSPSSFSVKVDFATADNSAKDRVGTTGGDYIARTGTLTFAPGETTKNITVSVIGETIYELNENFFVNLTNPVNGTIGRAQSTGSITNDDLPPTVTISNAQISEGNSGTKRMTFQLLLSSPSEVQCRVQWDTQDVTALAASDYVSVVGGAVLFPLNTRTAQAFVTLQGDKTVEADEQFKVKLSNALNCTIGTAEALGTIVNDDAAAAAIAEEPSE